MSHHYRVTEVNRNDFFWEMEKQKSCGMRVGTEFEFTVYHTDASGKCVGKVVGRGENRRYFLIKRIKLNVLSDLIKKILQEKK